MKSNGNVDLVFKLCNIEFKLNDNQYVGGFRYNNKNIKIVFDASDETQGILEKYKSECENLLKNFDKNYKKIINECANKLITTANIWNEEDSHIITYEEFVERISKSDIEIYFGYGALSFDILDDDNLFLGHTISYSEDLETHEILVHI